MNWISVADRLPQISGSYLTFIPSKDQGKPTRIVAWYELPGSQNVSGWQLIPRSLCEAITHWSEWPEDPK